MTIRANLFPGDTLKLYASAANNSGQDIYGDVFLGLIAPGGEIYFFDSSLNLLPSDESDPKTFTPFAENVPLPTGFTLPPTEFFSVELPDYVPEGTWTAFAALTEPGSTKTGSVRLIGDISLAEMKFSKGGSGTDTISITGEVTPPAGSSPDSLTLVSAGKTSLVAAQGDFSTEVYRDAVTLLAVMPEGKEFGLMNIAVTRNQKTNTSSHAGKSSVKLKTAAYQDSTTGQVTINAQTTAVSMVFMTPYFLTNDPTRADELLDVIANDPKVAELVLSCIN